MIIIIIMIIIIVYNRCLFYIFQYFNSSKYGITIRGNCLVVKVLDSQSRGPEFSITGWLQVRLSL